MGQRISQIPSGRGIQEKSFVGPVVFRKKATLGWPFSAFMLIDMVTSAGT